MTNIIKIQNCNCIKNADITIIENCLNIKYGVNGTGKSTIGLALSSAVEPEQSKLMELCPYGADESKEEEIPKVLSFPYHSVKVFNEDYVRGYLFKGNGFFDDPFQVFLNSDKCNQLMDKITELLADLQGVFLESDNIRGLKDFLPEYFAATKYKDGSINVVVDGSSHTYSDEENINEKTFEVTANKEYYISHTGTDYATVTEISYVKNLGTHTGSYKGTDVFKVKPSYIKRVICEGRGRANIYVISPKGQTVASAQINIE